MKKVLIVLCLMLLALPVFAEYKPIPANRSAEYKAEIEQYVKTNAPYYKNQMDNEVLKAKKIYYFALRDKKNKDSYMEQLDGQIRSVDSDEFNFYRKMIVITMKYVNIEADLPHTDWIGDYINLLTPYLKDNKIDNTKEIDSVSFYAYDKNKEIEKMMEVINRTIF